MAVWRGRSLRAQRLVGSWVVLQALCSFLICAAASSSPASSGNTPLNGCAQSIWQLFPPEANVTEVTKLYAKADERIRRVFPDVSTSGAYTIFLSIDAALSVAGDISDPVNQVKTLSDEEFTAWVLYNMLPTPMPVDQIGLARRIPTMLSRATQLDVYDLRSSLPANFAFGGRVELFDLLGSEVQILASFPICNSWVHTINGILWPATRANISALPEPLPGGSLDGNFIPPQFPNPSSIGSLTAQLPNPIAGLPNPPAGLPNPAAGQQVVQKVVSAVTAGISGVVNSISNNGENQPPLPGPGGLPALPGQQGTVSGVPPPPANITLAAVPDSGTSKTGRLVGGILGGIVGILVIVGLAAGAAFHHRKHMIVMVRPTAGSMTKDDGGYYTPKGLYSTGSGLSAAGADAKVSTLGIGDGGLKDSASSVDGGGFRDDLEQGLDIDDYGDMYRARRTGSGDTEEVGVRAEWEVPPEDITICKDSYGRDWQLGSGGFGSVYRATLQGSTPVAVKFVSGHSPKEQTRFRNEVDILKGLRHTNIVQFLGASLAAGQIMLVTEYLPRGDLWRALSNDAGHLFNWYNRGRQVALDIVRGLQYMHSKKIMHLDLKSANILLARDGSAKIADVGLAKILTRDNTHVSMEGTFDWAAPEVLAGQEVSEKCDIWSLGVVLWEIVTGERPHLRQLRPLRVPEECPEEVEAIISSCRRVNPAERPTAREVYDIISRSPSRQNSVVNVDRNNSSATVYSQGPWSTSGAVSIAPRNPTSTTSSCDEPSVPRRPPLSRHPGPSPSVSASEEHGAHGPGIEARDPGTPAAPSESIIPGDRSMSDDDLPSRGQDGGLLDTGQRQKPVVVRRPVVYAQAAASPFAGGMPAESAFYSPREHESASVPQATLADCAVHPSMAAPDADSASAPTLPKQEAFGDKCGRADEGDKPIGSLLVRHCSSISEEPGIPAVQGRAPPSALPKQTSLGRVLPTPTPSPFSRMTIGGVTT